MFRKMLSYGGLLLLVGAAILVAPGSSQAAVHGGAHFGGGHFGGAHFGGAHFGGAHFGGAHFGGFRGSGIIRGSHFGFPRSNFFGPFRSGYYGGYGYYPNYGGYYPYYGDYSAYPSDLSVPGYNTEDYGPAEAAVTPVQPDPTAHITVNVPPDAAVWFEGTRTTSTGSVREFQSPPLTSGSRYSYTVRARWDNNGQEVTQSQQVTVTAGAHIDVTFPLPPKSASQATTLQKE